MPTLEIIDPEKTTTITSVVSQLTVLDPLVNKFLETIRGVNNATIGGLASMDFQPIDGTFTEWRFAQFSRNGRRWRQRFRPGAGDSRRTQQVFDVPDFWEISGVLPLLTLTDALLLLMSRQDVVAFTVNFTGSPPPPPPGGSVISEPPTATDQRVTNLFVRDGRLVVEYEIPDP